jgi:hypothetical protein
MKYGAENRMAEYLETPPLTVIWWNGGCRSMAICPSLEGHNENAQNSEDIVISEEDGFAIKQATNCWWRLQVCTTVSGWLAFCNFENFFYNCTKNAPISSRSVL